MAIIKGIFSLLMPTILLFSSLAGQYFPNNNPISQKPVAINDNFALNINSELMISAPGVLFNDLTTNQYTLSAIILNNPTNGSLVLNPDGSFVYTPVFNFVGMDSFTYRANDGQADSNEATVFLTIDPSDDLVEQPFTISQPAEVLNLEAQSLYGITVTTVAPTNGATEVATSPSLRINATDSLNSNLQVSFYGRQKTTEAAENFILATIPDTQFYSINTGGYVYFNAETTWLANNQTARNIIFVTHTGDITQDGDNDTDDSEWLVADNAMSILERDPANPFDDVPYSISPGNHDALGSVGGVLAHYDAHFPKSRYVNKPYYGGSYTTNNYNSYSLFSSGDMHFIVINLACTGAIPTTAVLNWADGLLKNDVSRRGIVVCHNAMDGSTGLFTSIGRAIFTALSDNPNWFLLLAGHTSLTWRVDQGGDGHSIYSIVGDYEGTSNGGNGYVRLLQFQPSNNQIQVMTYSPTINNGAGGYNTDPRSQYAIPYTMQAPDFTLIGTVSVPSGSDASITWPGLADNTEYEWYAVARNATNNSVGDIQSFTTGSNSTASPTPTPTPTSTKTPLPTATKTSTSTPTASNTPKPTATKTPTSTATKTSTITPTASNTPSATATNTPLFSPTASYTPAPTKTNTPSPTATNTSTYTPTASNTPSATATNTPLFTPTPSYTPEPTATYTPSPTATNTSTSTPTASSTPLPTATHTPLPTSTSTVTSTPTKTNTPTLTPTRTSTPSPTPTPITVFSDNFDPSTELWSHNSARGIDDWQPSSKRAHSPVTSYYCSEPATIKDDYLLSRSILIPTHAMLSFWHTYQLETGRDGAVIEISTDNGVTFTDLGSLVTKGKYNGAISTKYSNPIGGRSAWTGSKLSTWTQVVVDLSSYAGQSVILRFRLASDNRRAGSGWFIDDVTVIGS